MRRRLLWRIKKLGLGFAVPIAYSVVWVKVIKKIALFQTADVHEINLRSKTERGVKNTNMIIEPPLV